MLVPEERMNGREGGRHEGQQPAFVLPALEVLQRLQLHHIRHQCVRGQLVVHAHVVDLAVVDDDVDVREARLEAVLCVILLVRRVATSVDDQPAALGLGCLVHLVEDLLFLVPRRRIAQRQAGQAMTPCPGWAWPGWPPWFAVP